MTQTFSVRLRMVLPRYVKLYAADLGVDQSTVSRWRNGGPISLEHVMKICRWRDVSADWLLLERGAPHAHRDCRATADELELLGLLRAHGPDAVAVVLAFLRALQAG